MEEENLDPRKSPVVTFIILVIIVLLVLALDWLFGFMKDRM